MMIIPPRLRIGIVLMVSFLVSGFIMNYVEQSTEMSSPHIVYENIFSDFSTSFSGFGNGIISALKPMNNPPQNSSVAPAPEEPQYSPTQYIFPSPYPTPTHVFPTAIRYSPTKRPTRAPKPTAKIRVTNTPPTSVPQPTKKPSPTPTPLAPPEYIRPGKSLEDIYKVAGETSCVPAALLKAFVAQEGPGALSYSDESALFYNAYDWWHRVKEPKQVCGGYGFVTETGLIAQDSMFAGEKCKEPFSATSANSGSNSMGATQILQSYWDKTYRDKVKQKLKVGQVDRRVLLDSLVGFGLIVIDNTKYSGSCTNWEFKYVIKAACANAGGSCEPYNYCYTICNNYNKYANQNNNCNNVKDLFVPGSYCEFK